MKKQRKSYSGQEKVKIVIKNQFGPFIKQDFLSKIMADLQKLRQATDETEPKASPDRRKSVAKDCTEARR
ncbi:MAG: hypothetical protein ACUBOA_13585 [Candidatus Loosdrechtia sp.]|uniref:hypothetical protein n=1 Tax=Candidatus Loosdrechtia sp. TaxID=3101272 RepID=UPI003A6FDC0A|nr:MAG: hypothetical protein QY305_06810 [Candidatus Jettenia sp. AMX2]